MRDLVFVLVAQLVTSIVVAIVCGQTGLAFSGFVLVEVIVISACLVYYLTEYGDK